MNHLHNYNGYGITMVDNNKYTIAIYIMEEDMYN